MGTGGLELGAHMYTIDEHCSKSLGVLARLLGEDQLPDLYLNDGILEVVRDEKLFSYADSMNYCFDQFSPATVHR